MTNLRALGLLALFSCMPVATAPRTYDVHNTFAVASSPEDTWSALVDIFAANQWQIDKIDKASGLITADRMLVSKSSPESVASYADCGEVSGESERDKLATTVSFNIVTRAAGTGTTVTVNASFNRMGRACASTGGIENMIRDSLRANAKKRPDATKDGRKTVEGDKTLLCAISAPDVGQCFLDEAACSAEAAKVGVAQCEKRPAGSCFNATRTLEGTKATVCAVSIKDCEARRAQYAADPDYSTTACGIYRAK